MLQKPKPDDACKTCIFYKARTQDLGNCRRYPPRHFSTNSGEYNFPVIFNTTWCGEFKRSKVKQSSIPKD